MKSLDLKRHQQALRDGKFTLDSFLDHRSQRIKESQKVFHPWASTDKLATTRSLEEAIKLREKKGSAAALFGVACGIKDIINTKDFPTQMGSPIWSGFLPGNDARIVSTIKSQGGIVMGKTETAEFAVHKLNRAKNPYDTKRTPGTSSSGSAVAVALENIQLSICTQTAGSIIRPASYCGVYGFKPSFGTIPRTGILKTTDTLDTVGFHCWHGNDIKPYFSCLRVQGPNYPFVHNTLDKMEREGVSNNKKWRVGVVKADLWGSAKPYAKEALMEFAKQLSDQPNMEVTYDLNDEFFDDIHDNHSVIYQKSLAYYFQNEAKQHNLVSETMKEMIEKGNMYTIDNFVGATVHQEKKISDVNKWFANIDILISLSTAGEAPLRDEIEIKDTCLLWTYLHLPTIGVPKFKSPAGNPFGLQLIAKKYNDYLLIEFLEHLIAKGLAPAESMKPAD